MPLITHLIYLTYSWADFSKCLFFRFSSSTACKEASKLSIRLQRNVFHLDKSSIIKLQKYLLYHNYHK